MKTQDKIEAYPLCWPSGWPRAVRRREAAYRLDYSKALRHLVDELRKMGVARVVISTNLRLRQDGFPYADEVWRKIDDPGVAVYFERAGEAQVLACDKWNKTGDNLRAIGLTVEALRGIDRAGASELLDRAFTGFKALPPEGGTDTGRWWMVLGVSEDAPLGVAKAAYRRLAEQLHPDRGGDHGAMAMVNRAWEQYKTKFGIT